MVDFNPADWPKFVQTRVFSAQWDSLGMTDGDLSALEGSIIGSLLKNPII
jgi:hypothetical protein